MSQSHSSRTPGKDRRAPGRPSRQVADTLPASILASARGLFLEKGFAATTLQEIASSAGVTKRTLYVKVGDKEAMFSAVIRDMLQDWRHVVVAHGAGATVQARFEQLGFQLLAVMLAPDMVRLHRVLLSEVYRFPGLVTLLTGQIEQGPIPQLARLLAGIRQDGAEPTRDDQVAARMFYDMVLASPMQLALTGRERVLQISDADWVRQVVSMFLQGWQGWQGAAAGVGP